MIRILDITDSSKWDEIVSSFAHYDVYYLSGYVRAFMINGDGMPQLLYYVDGQEEETASLRAIYVFMKRKTALKNFFDCVTPYGYGGVLFEGDTSVENVQIFWEAYVAKMKAMNIVDNFVRYHPVLQNAESMRKISNVIDLGNTIAVDLSSPAVIWDNMISKNRNMIRKARKHGIIIGHGRGMELLEEFRGIYNTTMEHVHASAYYFFGKPFYESIHQDLSNHYEVFYAMQDGKIIAMSIMLFANNQMHYHLSGSLPECRYMAPTNLLLYEAALWGCQQGFKTLHLGGGVGSDKDSLYRFKASFNRHSCCQFSLGKEIFNQEAYDELVALRTSADASFDKKSSFFPIYRYVK